MPRAELTLEDRDRRKRRRLWLVVLAFTLLIYPALLLGSSHFGSSVGVRRDVNASRALARALNYAADPRLPVDSGNDGLLVTALLDPSLVALQLADTPASAGSPQALLGVPGASPSSTPAGGGGAPGAGGGGTVAGTPTPGGTGPSASPTAPQASPTAPPGSPTPSPTAAPTPPPTCGQPKGSGTFSGRLKNALLKDVADAVIKLSWHGCLIAATTSAVDGSFAIPRLAPKTTYSYVISAASYIPNSGSFVTSSVGSYNAGVILLL